MPCHRPSTPACAEDALGRWAAGVLAGERACLTPHAAASGILRPCLSLTLPCQAWPYLARRLPEQRAIARLRCPWLQAETVLDRMNGSPLRCYKHLRGRAWRRRSCNTTLRLAGACSAVQSQQRPVHSPQSPVHSPPAANDTSTRLDSRRAASSS